MCRFASGFFKPDTMELRVWDLNSHSETAEHFGIKDANKPNDWREFHYTPNGEIDCRVLEIDAHTKQECESAMRAKYPDFNAFLRLALPQEIGGGLYVSGCDLKGVTLPQEIGGGLNVRDCDLKGVTLPQKIGGWLDVSGCDLKGVTLPQEIGGSLNVSGCDLKGVKIPPRFKNKIIK